MKNTVSSYATLLDEHTLAFIEQTEAWYPPDAVEYSIAQQREIYDAMCRQFHAGYPDGVAAQDETLKFSDCSIAVRHYSQSDSTALAQIIYFHGGGFVVGGLQSHDDVCADICAATACEVTSVDYRLSPEFTHPAAFDDAMACVHHQAASSYLPIILCGDSAGGNIAAAVSHAVREQSIDVAGQLLIYPGLGGDSSRGSYIEHADSPMLTTRDIDFYVTIRAGSEQDYLDPTFAPLSDNRFDGLPRTVVISAECDPLSDDGRDYCCAINNAGGQAVWFNERGLVHGYLRARHSVPRAQKSFMRITDQLSMLASGNWLHG